MPKRRGEGRTGTDGGQCSDVKALWGDFQVAQIVCFVGGYPGTGSWLKGTPQNHSFFGGCPQQKTDPNGKPPVDLILSNQFASCIASNSHTFGLCETFGA